MTNPRSFGRNVARAQDRLFDEETVTNRAEAFLFDTETTAFGVRPRRAWNRVVLAAAAAAVLLIVGAGIVVVHRHMAHPSLTATIDGKKTAITESLWVQSPKGNETAISFSDGSRIRLETETRTRFIDITDNGAEMLVEQGRMAADITHRPKSRWRFYAGPFEVEVTGTRFDLTWDHQRAFFSVAMREGSVRITAPTLNEPRSVVAGEVFNAWVDEKRMEIAKNPSIKDADADVSPARADTNSPLVALGERGDAVSSDTATSAESVVKSRRMLSEERVNPPEASACSSITAAKAMKQADAARRDGDIPLATSRYDKIRRCFNGSREAALAAFSLGKIAFDNRQDWPAASRWFEQYLSEQHGEGPVREAMGRLMEAYVNGHRRKDALRIAGQYLAQYPGGPHAAFATSLIEEETDFKNTP